MGRLILPNSGPLYFDANVAIYRFEGIEPYASASEPLWEALQNQSLPIITSELTLLEVLVKPMREGNTSLLAVFRKMLLDTQGLQCLIIDRKVLELAAQIRAKCRLKTADAIHAATALRAGASLFLTNDKEFRRVPGLSVVILAEVASTDPETESG